MAKNIYQYRFKVILRCSRHALLQGAVEWDQLAARGFRTAGLSTRQPPVLRVSEPAQLSVCTQELSYKEAEGRIPEVPKSNFLL